METGIPVVKILIKYNSNSLGTNDEEEKKPINIELTDQKQILIMMKMLLTLNDQVYKKKTKKILRWLTSVRACKRKLMRKFLQKSSWMIVVSYLMKRKIKKVFLEVISNTIYIYTHTHFFNEVANDLDFVKLTGGIDNVQIRYNIVYFLLNVFIF